MIVSVMTIAGFAQRTVTGKVVEQDTKDAVIQATASLLSGEKVVSNAVTNADGNFSVKAPSDGTFTLRITYVGFKTYTKKITVAEGKSVSAGTISLAPDAIMLQGATVTAHLAKVQSKGDTLIFFDEVQECPDIVTAIKFLVDDGSYRYILSGSLLGVELKDIRSVPVGYMGIKEMFPIDFEEFISCVGIRADVIASIKEAWEKRHPVDGFIHEKMMELFRLYLIVGGMPAAVSKYIESNNLQEVLTVQQEIIQLYKKDIAKYDPDNKLYIEEIFSLIPPELNAKNKRFILKRLNENAKYERYENSFLWLKNAGVALPVYNVEEPKVPLLLARSRNLLKLFLNDIGLLAAQYANGIQVRIIKGDKDINFGSIYENAVAQELVAHGLWPYYYNNKKRGELDFVIEQDGKVLPIEVKSGKGYTYHRALTNIMDCGEYDLPEALILNNDNLFKDGRFLYIPVYMVMFLKKIETTPTAYKVDLGDLADSR